VIVGVAVRCGGAAYRCGILSFAPSSQKKRRFDSAQNENRTPMFDAKKIGQRRLTYRNVSDRPQGEDEGK
jgi:hypothetical protein